MKLRRATWNFKNIRTSPTTCHSRSVSHSSPKQFIVLAPISIFQGGQASPERFPSSSRRGFSTVAARERNTAAIYRELRDKNNKLVNERDDLR